MSGFKSRAMQIVSTLLLTVIAVSGCAAGSDRNSAVAASTDIESAIISGIYENPIRLERGRFEGEPFSTGSASRPTIVLLAEPRARADIDDDGDIEALAVLSESSGGSGTFHYLAVLDMSPGGFRSQATVLLGDRIQVTRLEVAGALVNVGLIEARPTDPVCCPGKAQSRSWLWADDDLRPVLHLAGELVYGHETRQFVTCGGDRFWVTDETGGDLQRAYQARVATPYQPLFARIEAARSPAPDSGFAAGYHEQLRVTALERLEGRRKMPGDCAPSALP